MTPARWSWTPRAEPLAVSAVFAEGHAARVLARRVADAVTGLQGLATVDSFLCVGDASLLPWVDGVVYLGRDALAPRLLLPTTHMPDLPLAACEAAILAKFGAGHFAIVGLRVIPLARLADLSSARLRAFADGVA